MIGLMQVLYLGSYIATYLVWIDKRKNDLYSRPVLKSQLHHATKISETDILQRQNSWQKLPRCSPINEQTSVASHESREFRKRSIQEAQEGKAFPNDIKETVTHIRNCAARGPDTQQWLGQQFRLVNFTAAPYSYPADIVAIWSLYVTYFVSRKKDPRSVETIVLRLVLVCLSIVTAYRPPKRAASRSKIVVACSSGEQNGDPLLPISRKFFASR